MTVAPSSDGSAQAATHTKERVLLVDDEPQILVALEDQLADRFVVYKAESAEHALNVVEKEPEIAVVLSDQRMPTMTGDELFARLSERCRATRILVTGYADLSAVIRAVNNGKIFAYVTKPWHADDLLITVQRGAEYFRLNRDLARERQLLSDLMNNIPDGIYFKDRELRFLRANGAFARLLNGGDAQSVIGKRISDLARNEDAESMERAELELLRAGVPVCDMITGFRSKAGRRWFSMTKAPIRSGDGEVLGLVGIVRDVTQRLEIEEALRVSEERLRLTFLGSNAGLFDWNLVNDELTHSPRFAAVLGLPENARLKSFSDFSARVHPEDAPGLDEALRRHLHDKKPFNGVEFRARTEDGSWRWFSASGQAVWNAEGRATRLVGSVNDISERKEQEERIARLTRIHAMLSAINSAIVRVSDREMLISESCSIAMQEGGLALAFVLEIDHDAGTLRVASTVDRRKEAFELLAGALGALDLTRGGSIADAINDQRPVLVNDVASEDKVPIRTELLRAGLGAAAFFPLFSSGRVESVFALFARQKDFFDSEEVKLLSELAENISFALNHLAQAQRLNFLAYYDELTGLPKRALLMDRIDQHIVSCRKEGRKLALVLLDIGRFRQINETLGRRAGDDLLLRVAERLKNAVGAQDTLARFDGNSFAVLISTVTDEADVASWVERVILPRLNQPFTVADTELRIAFNLAIALFPSDGPDADALASNAEAALKKAKVSGQRYVFYAPSMNAKVAEKLTLESKLRRALELDEFVLYYQPKVDLKTGRVVGLEALLRWRESDGELVPPGRFIPILEETGLILDAGRWVIERAAAQYAAWAEHGVKPPRIAVNVSALQLVQQDFVRTVERAIELHPKAESGIDLEITESVLMDDFAGNIGKLRAVKEMGICISIDDFGTGYSSLGYLSRLPIDALKVDRSFVVRMAEDPQEMAIVTTIISLAHSLDLKVIAEGVETPNQAHLLRLLKCDQIQGYLVAKPLPADDVRRLLDPRTTFRW